jgi:Fe-S-cluster containining protein
VGRGLALRRFRCTGCGNCCRELFVPLTDVDLARLVAEAAEPPEQLVDWLAPEAVDMSGEPSSFVELDVGRRLMVLTHRERACRFLVDDHCSVWQARPRTCRLYPLDASFGRRGGVHRLRVLAAGVDCRYTLDGDLPLAGLRDDHARHQAELARYHGRVAAWNRVQARRRRLLRRVGSAAEFLAALELAA